MDDGLENDFDNVGGSINVTTKDRDLMVDLIKWAGYKDQNAAQRAHTFDDPYVAARLYASDVPVGEHRKQHAGERHAEPAALLNALKNLAESTGDKDIQDRATQLLRAIEESYAAKSWLKGAAGVAEFENNWVKLGALLRELTGDSKTLRLFSTLEPCADYESQPACACLIRAAGIVEVLYGSDDINPKGKGRQKLIAPPEKGRSPSETKPAVSVYPNVAVRESHEINRLFFASFKLCERIYQSADREIWPAGAHYAFFRLGDPIVEPELIEAERYNEMHRVGIRLSEQMRVPIYRVGAQPWNIPSGLGFDYVPQTYPDELFEARRIDHELVLFCGQVPENDIANIIAHHSLAFGRCPGIVITTSADVPLSGHLSTLVSTQTVHYFHAAFQRLEARANAERLLYADELSKEPNRFLFVLNKYKHKHRNGQGSTSYRTGFFDRFTDWDKLHVPSGIRGDFVDTELARVSIFLSGKAGSINRLASLLVGLSKLNTRSFSVDITAFSDGAVAAIVNHLSGVRTLESQSPYALITQSSFSIRLTPQRLKTFIDAGLDPRSLLGGYVSDLASSNSWIERRHAGQLFAHAARFDRTFVESHLLPMISELGRQLEVFRQQDASHVWQRLCAALNAMRPLLRAPLASEGVSFVDVIAVHLCECTENVERFLANHIEDVEPPSWTVDVCWRLIACLVACKNAWNVSNRGHRLINCQHFWKFVASNQFLLCEAVCYALAERDPPEALRRIRSAIPLPPATFTRPRSVARYLALIGLRNGTVAKECYSTLKDWIEAPGESVIEDAVLQCSEVLRRKLLTLPGNEDASSYVRYADLTVLHPHAEQEAKGHGSWSKDKEEAFSALLSVIPQEHRLRAIESLLADGDPTLQWAALVELLRTDASMENVAALTLSGDSQVIGSRKLRSHLLRRWKTDAIERLMVTPSIYWFEREILQFYADQLHHNQSLLGKARGVRSRDYEMEFLNEIERCAVPSLSHFSFARKLLRDQTTSTHPEVTEAIAQWRRRGRTIALVLPPIKFSEERSVPEFRQRTATPPLGIGSIASLLSAAGHYVAMFDAHHFAYTVDTLAQSLVMYDLVGFSVVDSTRTSAKKLADKLRHASSTLSHHPLIVFGGHAVTLYARQDDAADWGFDLAIKGPAELDMTRLAFDLDYMLGPNVIGKRRVDAH